MIKKNKGTSFTFELKKRGKKSNQEKIYEIFEFIYDNLGFNIYDTDFGDGYFIFNHGKNSVCHFKIKQCKGWQFGIWLEYNNGVYANIFAQPLNNIDKFKPSRSYYSIELKNRNLTKDNCEELFSMIKEIKKYPYIAWYNDNHCCGSLGYNYISNIKAFIEYIKYIMLQNFNNFQINFIKFRIFNYLNILHKLKFINEYAIVCYSPDSDLVIHPKYNIDIVSKIKYADAIDKHLEKLKDKDANCCFLGLGYDIQTYDDNLEKILEKFHNEYNKKLTYKEYKNHRYYIMNNERNRNWAWEKVN